MELTGDKGVGEVVVRMRIHGGLGVIDVNALVDTGAPFTKISSPLAATLALQIERWVSIELGDGRVTQRELALVEVEVEGERGRVPVTIGAAEETPILGYTALEILGFKVNPVSRRLEKTTAIEY